MYWGLLLTFITGLFFLIGIVLYKKSNNKARMSIITASCAFIVIFGLIAFDLVPELLELKKWYFILSAVIGLVFLWLLDFLIPHHHHDHKDGDEHTKEHEDHLIHIGIVTIIALLLHNMVEGIALFSVTETDLKSGLLMCLGIGLHNIPLGFQVGSNKENKKSYLLLTLLVLSAFIGGLLVLFVGEISEIALGIITAFTLGMLLHILIFELLLEVFHNKGKKETYYGIIIGIIILILINLL